MSKPTAWETLCGILAESGARLTFSINCRSGLLPSGTCQCWRCKGERGEEATAESEVVAALRAVEADARFRVQMRDLIAATKFERCENDPPDSTPSDERGIAPHCPREALMSVGSGRKNWHLCAVCAILPKFRRFRRRVPLQLTA